MTEQLSEEKQRGIYEWFYPDELEGQPWHLLWIAGIPYAYLGSDTTQRFQLPPLYMPDGKVNYNFWMECAERLHQEGWHVITADSCVHNATIISRYDNPHIGFTDPDPWSALSELLEGE